MVDIENLVFDKVSKAIKATYSTAFVTGERIAVPTKFPCVFLIEDDNSTYTKSIASDLTENHSNLMYTAEAYSNLTAGKKAQAKAIMAIIDTQMLSMGFIRTSKTPIEMPNADANIYRIVARYTGLVSAKTISGDTTKFQIYRR